MTPEEAKEILAQPKADVVLVDVRPPEEFATEHIDAARNWPYAEILTVTSPEGVPADLKGKRLLLVCQSGIVSALTAQQLRGVGVADVANVQGGMQTWVASAEKPCTLGLCRLRTSQGETRNLPTRESPPLEQWAAVVTGLMIKPLYTVLAFLLVVRTWSPFAGP
jgi:rhodanese-related sulfurtransferase